MTSSEHSNKISLSTSGSTVFDPPSDFVPYAYLVKKESKKDDVYMVLKLPTRYIIERVATDAANNDASLFNNLTIYVREAAPDPTDREEMAYCHALDQLRNDKKGVEIVVYDSGTSQEKGRNKVLYEDGDT